MKRLAFKLVLAAVVFSVTTIRGSEAEKALEQMRSAFAEVESYRVTLVTHQEKGSATEDRTLTFTYERPGWIRTHIISGKNKGGIAVYNPEKEHVRVKQSGVPVVLTLSPDAGMVKGLRGERIYDGGFAALAENLKMYEKKGDIRWAGEKDFEGAECAVIELTTPNPEANHGIAKERWWLSKNTGFPKKTEGFDAQGKMVKWTIYRELELDPQLDEDTFNL